ncbi:MAG TPA: class I SAM-dependent methyltransferase [Candidatus Udaeobacter sp.]|nr:class I SAM-dependent methyltransferase [Candidatus Udaeobacter sp.]
MTAATTNGSRSLAEFERTLRDVIASPPSDVDPEFRHYFAALEGEGGLSTFMRHKRQLVGLAGGVRGKDVLDAGSGFGLFANLLSAWGARRIYAVELHPPRLTSHLKLNRARFPWIDNVHPIRGTVSQIPLARGSVDLVLSNEAVSHYVDLDAFIAECARTLRPGGLLVISDANNGDNPGIRAMTEGFWERLENGPAGRYEHHDISEPLVDRRARIIREEFPSMSEDAARELARATSGLDRVQIRDVIRAHLSGGPAPASFYRRGTLARDPEWGEVVERLFSPRQFARDIERFGFRARALPHYGGARNDVLRLANEVLRRVPSFRFARGFRLVAERV